MKKRLHIFCLLLPFIISIIVYLNCLQHSFVYDDDSTIVSNYFIRHWSNLPHLFTRKYFILSAELTYRPVVTVSYFIDYTFWHLNPLGYHLTNILLHATNSTLFFIFAFYVLKKRTMALIAALFFSSHPIFSEVVNAVGFREDLLAFLFLVMAFIFYLKSQKVPRDIEQSQKTGQLIYIVYYSLSLLCYFLSLFSKEMAITLPLLIILYDVIFRGLSIKKSFPPSPLPLVRLSTHNEIPSREGRTAIASFKGAADCHSFRLHSVGVRELSGEGFSSYSVPGRGVKFSYLKSKFLRYYSGYVFITIFYVLSRFFFLHNPQESHIPYPCGSLFVNFLTMPHVLAYYIKLLFLPFKLNADYVVTFSASPAEISFWLSALLFIATGVFTSRLRSQHKCIFFFILWFFVSLIPVMNIVPLGNIMAERYLYIPGTGFCMIAASLLSKLNKYSTANLNHIGSHASPPLLKGGESLHCFYPSSYPTHTGGVGVFAFLNLTGSLFIFVIFFILMGNAYLTVKRNNDWKDGLQLWSKTALTSPGSFRAHINLGNAYEKKGFNASALEEYNKALTINPNDADVYNNIGIYYDKMNLFDGAIQYYEKCLTIDSKHAKAHNNIGVVFTKQRLLDNAIQAFKQAISINPLYPDAHSNLGIAYYRKGLMDDAEREFKLTISIEPYHPEAHNVLGILYNDKHLYDDAIREFETAIRIKPDYANAHMNLGVVLLKQRKDRDTALFHLKESLKIEPHQEQASGIKKLIQQLEQTASGE